MTSATETPHGRAIVVAVGDEHCGHPFALCHPDPWTDCNQQVHTSNTLQEQIWRHWESCWRRVGELRRGARLIIVHMGDCVEGSHHGTTQLDTARRIEQEAIAIRCWREALELCRFRQGHDHLLGVVGSLDHVGPAGESDERLLRTLLHGDVDDGRLTHERLRFSVNGVTFEAWHRGPRPGSRDWTRPNALAASMRSYMYRNLRRGAAPVRYYLWGHYHQWTTASLQDDDGQIMSEGMICPAQKLKDEFVYTIDAEGLANVGLVVFEVLATGVSHWQALRLAVEQDEALTL